VHKRRVSWRARDKEAGFGPIVRSFLVAVPLDRQRLVEYELHSAELSIEKPGLFLVGIDADFDGPAHLRCLYAPAVLTCETKVRRQEVFAMWIVKPEIGPQIGVLVPADNDDRTGIRIPSADT
jgi:hypothetical protein